MIESGPFDRHLVFAAFAALGCAETELRRDGWIMNFCFSTIFARAPRGLPRRFQVFAAALCAFLTVAGTGAGAADVQSLEIVTRSGVQVFAVEVAKTEQERATGLMYRKELAEGRGMLFDFSPEQQVSMWMKNTFIPLDMIFIRSDGRILRIAENTEPHSEKIISSGGLAKGVLEVIGGTAKKYGIAPGDRVAHPLFGAR